MGPAGDAHAAQQLQDVSVTRWFRGHMSAELRYLKRGCSFQSIHFNHFCAVIPASTHMKQRVAGLEEHFYGHAKQRQLVAVHACMRGILSLPLLLAATSSLPPPPPLPH